MTTTRTLGRALALACALIATACGSSSNDSPASPPVAPTAVQAAPGNAQVTVSWAASSGATSYNLYWSTTSGAGTSGTKITGATSPYAHTGLTNGTTYYYVVTAVNSAGESSASAQVQATPAVNPPPAAPTNVVASAGNAQATVSWNAVSGATSYNLYWSTTPGAGVAGTKITGVTSPFVHTGRTNGTTYYYVVTAANANGESAASAQVSATPSAAPTPPFIHAVVISSTDGSVPPFGFTESIQVCSDATCNTAITTATVTVNGNSVPWNATRWEYQGSHIYAAGAAITVSVTVNGVTYTGSGTQFTQAPTITSPTSGATWQAASANAISWSGGSPTTGAAYVTGIASSDGRFVFPVPTQDNEGPMEVAMGTTSVTVPASTLPAGNFAAMVGIGTAGIVNRASAGIPIANAAAGSGIHLGLIPPFVPFAVQGTTAPSAPTNVQATAGDAHVTVSWSSVSGATSYNLYWSLTPGAGTSGTKITGVTSPYNHAGLINGVPYYYVVTAVNGAGESSPSSQVSATPVAPSGPPYIYATILTTTDNSTPPFGFLQQVEVCTDADCLSAISGATVTVNGTSVPWTADRNAYLASIPIAGGASVALSVTWNGVTYTANGTQFAQAPTITSPTSGATWQANAANTISWSGGSPTGGATYVVGVLGSNGDFVFPQGQNGGPMEVAIGTSSVNVPADTIGAGSYSVMVGIGTDGIVDGSTSGIAIANAASGSGMYLGILQPVVPITVQSVSAPYVYASILSMSDGTTPPDYAERVAVCSDAACSTPIQGATVTVNGNALTWSTNQNEYQGQFLIAAGASVTVSVTVNGVTYTGTGTQFSVPPTISSPTSFATWQAASANTITWSGGSPSSGAIYVAGVANTQGNFVFPVDGQGRPTEFPMSTTSLLVPAGSLTQGTYAVMVAIGTEGFMTKSSGGAPIANAAAGSGIWLGLVPPLVMISVQ